MADRFDTTRWSLILHAGGEGNGARVALDALCRTYRPPVLAYVRARCAQREDAEDLAQAFFEHLLEHRLAARADRERGRFRAFLLTSLRNFLASEHARASAQVRGGGTIRLLLEDADPGIDDGPEQAFEREWAQTVLSEALRRLQEEARRNGKEILFSRLRPFLLDTPDDDAYDAVAAALDMRRNTVAVAVHRLRARMQELVRGVVADTVEDDAQTEQELRRMRGSLQETSPGNSAARTP
jgi:RNA polymerase sigma factor (sigma-70 family)